MVWTGTENLAPQRDYIIRPSAGVKSRCGTVVKVLCYKSEGGWFDPSWCHWKFSLTKNPCDRTMGLGSTQPLTEEHFLGAKAAGA